LKELRIPIRNKLMSENWLILLLTVTNCEYRIYKSV
jgi:hypothetical protein